MPPTDKQRRPALAIVRDLDPDREAAFAAVAAQLGIPTLELIEYAMRLEAPHDGDDEGKR